MTEKPASLLDRLDAVAVTPAPLGELVRAGHAARRRRATWAGAGAALATAAIVVTIALLPGAQQTRRSDPTPLTDPTGAVGTRVSEWVSSLPSGPVPEVAYLQDMTLHIADGDPVELPGDDAAIIGSTVAGTVVLSEDSSGSRFRSRYLVVDPETGRYSELAPSLTTGEVQDELVSPDQRFFVSGRAVVDMADISLAEELPPDAAVLLSWTDAGIQYADTSGQEWLWEPGERPWALQDARTWFTSQLDPLDFDEDDAVGLARVGRCVEVVHVFRGRAYDERWGRLCHDPEIVTMSPEGTWLLTSDLSLVDAAQGTSRHLASSQSVTLPPNTQALWTSDSVVLLATPQGVVRCDALARTCERATTTAGAELPLHG